ncbi:glycoside hydrolase family protein [Paraburkholderia sp. SIMBA_027]|uniref:glycoside hydrolase family protein n=1 Tax=Paraburkholderia sp. SIMBA_027 TaxID=3085770 RepID=UPI00397C1EC7
MAKPLAGLRIAALRALAGVSGASALVALTSGSEGLSLKPYRDIAGVSTVCFGETNVKMKTYTLAQCQDILAGSLAGYAKGVRATVPGFDSLTPGQKAAAVDYAYNRGLGSWSRASLPGEPPSVLDAYKRHDFPAACDLYPKWAIMKRAGRWVDCSVRSNGCMGIYTRRMNERVQCLG